MLSFAGTLAVWAALLGAAWLTVTAWQAARRPSFSIAILRRPLLTMVWAAVGAMVILLAALLANDFTVSYVANHHSRHTPFPFNIATAWAALEGSIVLWGLVLAGYAYFVWRRAITRHEQPDTLDWGALAVIAAVGVFFFGLMATVGNPFEVCVEASARSCTASSAIPFSSAVGPADGAGPNPLLQNHILMAIHPPLLYLGYVGMTVPFAYGVAALALRRPGSEWLRRSGFWTRISWVFLTAGITLGAWWAYEVLGWGGYWAWDPVENASFMPWLVATAFLHSSLVQERRGMLEAWNFVLVIGTFSLTILGTFLTRSGVIASVHSFTQSAIGPALLGFLVVVVVGSFTLFAARSQQISSPPRLESLSSREGSFMLNNLLLSVYAMVVLTGTLYPLVLEAFSGSEVGVGRPFFDRLAVPISFALLLAMGVGPALPWRVARRKVVWPRVHLPLQVALGVGTVVVITTTRIGYVVLAAVAGSWVVAVAAYRLWTQAQRFAGSKGTSAARQLGRVIRSDRGFWGGQFAHAGVALAAVAIATTANLGQTLDRVDLTPGDRVEFAGYQLVHTGVATARTPNRLTSSAAVQVWKDDQLQGWVQPSLSQFETSALPIATPGIHRSFKEDLYLSLTRIDEQGITLRAATAPLQWVLWVGGLLCAAGGLYALMGRDRRRSRPKTAKTGIHPDG
ncbi:MAG: heme lyase CcmF/NrfE family subunit [bacterium]|nr:heme lyase CcmF/NrfE family subunit [Acidimicrobiia bacterium]MCY4648785.1 heme lyase CcmF/NrfE family subunit [bacterium]